MLKTCTAEQHTDEAAVFLFFFTTGEEEKALQVVELGGVLYLDVLK